MTTLSQDPPISLLRTTRTEWSVARPSRQNLLRPSTSLRIHPSVILRRQPVPLIRPPPPRFIPHARSRTRQSRIPPPPLRFHPFFIRKQTLVALKRIAQQPLIRSHLASRLMARDQFPILP